MNLKNVIWILILLTNTTTILSLQKDWYTDLQGKNGGTSVCNFLSLSNSAASLGRGLASSPGAYDATDLAIFPSISGLTNKNQFALTHLEWFMGLRKEYIGACFPMLDVGSFGFFAEVFTSGSFKNARDIDENPNEASAIDNTAGLSFGKSFFSRKLSIGLAAAYFESRLDDEAVQSAWVGGDLLLVPSKFLQFHAYATNIGPTVSYSGLLNEELPMETGLQISIMPLNKGLNSTNYFNFDISTGVVKSLGEPLLFGSSTQLSFGPYLKLRGGYDYKYGSEISYEGISLGFGIHKEIYGIDFAWRTQSKDLGFVWALGTKIQLEELRQKSAEEYFKTAMQHFTKKRYSQCIYIAEKAIKKDPNLWKAHALLSKARSMQLRQKRQEIALIYTSNISENFINHKDPTKLGGLAKIAGAINSVRTQYPINFSIDGGNIIKGTSDVFRTEIVQQFYNRVNYDIVSLGKGEIDFGLKRFFEESGYARVKFVNANYNDPFVSDLVSNKLIKAGKYSIFVTSLCNPKIISTPNNQKLKPFYDELTNQLRSSKAKNADVRIVVIQDTWESIKSYSQKLQDADIILCGNLKQQFDFPMQLGKTIVLSPGEGGKYVGVLTIRFTESGQFATADNKLIPLTDAIKPDSIMLDLVETFTAKSKLAEFGLDSTNLKKSNADGVFSFISNRHGYDQIFLKIPLKQADFPLTSDTSKLFENPSINFTAGKIGFIQTDISKKRALVVGKLSGTQFETIIHNLNVIDFLWSSKPDLIYFTGQKEKDSTSDIYKVNSSGGTYLPIINWKNSSERAPVLSPDGNYMIFESNRDKYWHLFYTNIEGEGPIRITDEQGNHIKAKYNKTGKLLAYLSDRANSNGKMDLWLYDFANISHKQITKNTNVSDYCWLDDGRTIIFSSGINMNDLSSVDVINLNYKKFTSQDSTRMYSEAKPFTLFYKNQEKVVFEKTYENGLKELFWINADGSDEERIIKSKGDDWLIKK